MQREHYREDTTDRQIEHFRESTWGGALEGTQERTCSLSLSSSWIFGALILFFGMIFSHTPLLFSSGLLFNKFSPMLSMSPNGICTWKTSSMFIPLSDPPTYASKFKHGDILSNISLRAECRHSLSLSHNFLKIFCFVFVDVASSMVSMRLSYLVFHCCTS